MISGKDSKYKFFWKGNSDGNAGVGVLIAEKWIESVVDVKRVNERMILVKMIIGEKLVNVMSAYAPQTGRGEEEKDEFWSELLSVTSSVTADEIIVLGGDLNGHVGSKGDGYEGVHGGYGLTLKRRLIGYHVK